MNEIDRTNWSDQTKFRLNEVSKIENYFIEEINQRKSCSKKLSKYVAAFDYIDKILIVLSATSGGVCIFCEYCWSTTSNSRSKFYFNFFCNHRNNKKTAKHNKKQKEKA